MPTYMLEGAVQVSMTARPITLSLRLEGATQTARLEAVREGLPLSTVVRPRPDLLIVPQVDGVVTVRVVPTGVPRFESQTIGHLSLRVDDPGSPDPDRGVLVPIDLTGLTGRDLIVLESDGAALLVRAARVLAPPADLGVVGNAARAVTTEILGVQVVEDLVALNVVIVVDTSASMTRFERDGTVATVVDLLAGVGDVVSPGMKTAIATVGREARIGRGVRPVELAAERETAVAGRTAGTGLRSGADGLTGFAPESNTVTYLVTDAVPADVDDLVAADSVPGEARHLVIVGTAAASALQPAVAVPTTLVHTPAEPIGLADQLLGDRAQLQRTVRSLLAGCFPPGTSAHERSAR
jgi:hypothetical protein